MILCCGEALIDFVPIPGERAYRPLAGGSVMNIAVALGRLEVPVGFFCKLSTDFFGDLLAAHIKGNGVDISLCPRVNGPTTLAFVSLPEKDSTEPQFAFYANNAVDRSLEINELPAELDNRVRALHFGSISLVLEPGASALETLMERESNRRIISLDPNIRPAVISNRDAYRQRFESWLAYVDILRLSTADLDWLYPGTDWHALLPGWIESGVKLVLVTEGARGASGVSSSGEIVFVPAIQVEVSDTVGAGDTFLAGALAYLHDHNLLYDRSRLASLPTDDMRTCLEYASRAAAINCTRAGANPPYKHEMVS